MSSVIMFLNKLCRGKGILISGVKVRLACHVDSSIFLIVFIQVSGKHLGIWLGYQDYRNK